MKTKMGLGSNADDELALGELSSAIFEAAVDSMIVINQYGIIHELNPAAERTFGYDRSLLIGKNVSSLMPEKDAKQHDGYLLSYTQTGERKMIGKGREVVGKRKDGSLFPMHLSVGELVAGDKKFYIGICHDTSRNNKMLEKITYMASHDSLTGCLNRNYLHSGLERLMDEARDNKLQLSALFIDLDGFKQINDHYDHDVGDHLLASVAQRIKALLGSKDLLARIGGDEFLVASNLAAEGNAARKLAQSILDSLKKPFTINGIELRVRASIGISLYPGYSRSSDQLINDADIAMYQAKIAGGNCMRFFKIEQREKVQSIFETVKRLRRAIKQGSFELHYQLQFELSPPYRPIGLEALVRWRDGDNGLVMPDNFIPLALEYGMLPALSRWVTERACADNLILITEQLLDAPVAVNIGSESFLHKNFLSMITSALKQSGLAANRLEVEITESVALHNLEQACSITQDLNDLGVNVSVDDFGTGYSSPGMLRRLPAQRLKIDSSFVRELPSNRFDQAVIKSMLIMANSVDMQVIAEGIESIEQLELLRSLGCEQGQGYWYAKPMPLTELKILLKQKNAAL